MRILLAILLLALGASAVAQETQPEQRRGRRAPLANVDDVEPAVDVSEPRVAIITPAHAQETQRTPAEAPPATAQAAPPSAPTPASPPPSAPSAGNTQERPAPRVMDSLDLGTTSITGNAELPKVLYIVPWKKSDLGDLVGRPVNTLLDEVLAPVDPAVFERHLSYYDSLYGERDKE
jgi:hypothetical protein